MPPADAKPQRNSSSKGSSRGRKPRKPARRERSAGVVVFRDEPTPSGQRRLYLLLDYGRHWDYPKGHLEKGEDDTTAARRELAEETGITDAELIDGFCHEITYHFHSSRKGLVRKEVAFFVAHTHSANVRVSDEHVGYAWLELEPALAQVTFENARNVLAAAAAYLYRLDMEGQSEATDDEAD